MFRKIRQLLTSSSPSEDEKGCFYNLSTTCQIPKLDVVYEQYFGHKTDGCFVEVGAFDGEYASNTSCLADIGWYGFYIEPVPEYFQRCVARHAQNKNITVSQYAIGMETQKVEINVGGPLSTISDKMRKGFDSLDWAKGNFGREKVQVNQVTLEDYLVKNKVKKKFELLVVDVEGYEWNVMRSFDIQEWMPDMIIIELHDQNDDYLFLREKCNNIVRYFDDNCYKVIFKDFTNTIYVPKDAYPGLRSANKSRHE